MTPPATHPIPAEEEIAIPFDADEVREPSSEIDCSVEDAINEFESGMLGAEDFEQARPRPPESYAEDEAVPVFPLELPPTPESDAPAVELLLNEDQATRLLDSRAPDWRRWGRPPTLRASGHGWYASGWSDYDLRRWAERRTQKSSVTICYGIRAKL